MRSKIKKFMSETYIKNQLIESCSIFQYLHKVNNREPLLTHFPGVVSHRPDIANIAVDFVYILIFLRI